MQDLKSVMPKLRQALTYLLSTYEGLDISSHVVLNSIENEMILTTKKVFENEDFHLEEKIIEYSVKISLQILVFKYGINN